MPIHSSPTVARLVFLDWLRIFAFALLVFYHVGMVYVIWDWHIKSPQAGAFLEPLMLMSSPWRMDLLFLVSGAATSCMLARGGATGALLRVRARRLLLPLLFGMLVVVPPQSYIEVVHKLGYAGDYLDFMGLYLRAYGAFCFAPGKCLILPTWNHLWFLPYLFAYTLVLWGWLRLQPNLLDQFAVRLPGVMAGARLLLWPIVLLVISRVLLHARFPVTHALAGDWFAHSQYFAMFLLGAVLARAPALWARMAQLRWAALMLALAAWVVLVAGRSALTGGALTAALIGPIFYGIEQWCAMVAALGFARVHLNRDGALRRYLTEAVFPVYVLHQTLIIMLAHTLGPSQIAPPLEGALLALGTFALSFAGFECIRRVFWVRPLFGLQRKTQRGKIRASLAMYG